MSDSQTEERQEPRYSMTYVALKRLKVGNGYREPGDEVPEARGWRNVQAWINRSMLQAVPVIPEQIAGGVDMRSQAGRAESSRPLHKPVFANQGPGDNQPTVSSATVDFDRLTAAQIQAGLTEGRLERGAVERYETAREKPRKGVLRALGWEDHEISQGYRDADAPAERQELPGDKPYDQWSDEELKQAWAERYGSGEDMPDDREGLIEDLEAPEGDEG